LSQCGPLRLLTGLGSPLGTTSGLLLVRQRLGGISSSFGVIRRLLGSRFGSDVRDGLALANDAVLRLERVSVGQTEPISATYLLPGRQVHHLVLLILQRPLLARRLLHEVGGGPIAAFEVQAGLSGPIKGDLSIVGGQGLGVGLVLPVQVNQSQSKPKKDNKDLRLGLSDKEASSVGNRRLEGLWSLGGGGLASGGREVLLEVLEGPLELGEGPIELIGRLKG
jgi:hypothetical protein